MKKLMLMPLLPLIMTLACEPESNSSTRTNKQSSDQTSQVKKDNSPQKVEDTNQPSAEVLASMMLSGQIKLEADLAVAAMSAEDIKASIDALIGQLTLQLDLDKDGKLSPEELKKQFDTHLAQFKEHFKIDKIDRPSIEKVIRDHIDGVKGRHKDVFSSHRKELCDRFQVKSEQLDLDKVAQSPLYDRILARCEGLDVPEVMPLDDMRKELCNRFEDFLVHYHNHGDVLVRGLDGAQISANVKVDASPVQNTTASASLHGEGKLPLANFSAMLGHMAHRYCADTLPPVTPPPGGEVLPPIAKVYSGYDMNGTQTTCPIPEVRMMCPAIFGPTHVYANKCVEAGFQVYNCSCNVQLCSQKLDVTAR